MQSRKPGLSCDRAP